MVVNQDYVALPKGCGKPLLRRKSNEERGHIMAKRRRAKLTIAGAHLGAKVAHKGRGRRRGRSKKA